MEARMNQERLKAALKHLMGDWCNDKCDCEQAVLAAFEELEGRVENAEIAARVARERAEEKSEQREFEVEQNVKLTQERDRLKETVEDWIDFWCSDGKDYMHRANKAEASLERIVEPLRGAYDSRPIFEFGIRNVEKCEWGMWIGACIRAICDHLGASPQAEEKPSEPSAQADPEQQQGEKPRYLCNRRFDSAFCSSVRCDLKAMCMAEEPTPEQRVREVLGKHAWSILPASYSVLLTDLLEAIERSDIPSIEYGYKADIDGAESAEGESRYCEVYCDPLSAVVRVVRGTRNIKPKDKALEDAIAISSYH